MTYQQVMELFLQLLLRTRAGEVTWEFLVADEMVRIGVGNRLFRIGHTPGPDDEPMSDAEVTYPIWVIGPYGGVSNEYVVTPREQHDYELVSQLYREARLRAVDSNEYFQRLLDAMEAK